MSHPLIGPLCPLLVVFNVGHLNFSKANFGNLFDAVCTHTVHALNTAPPQAALNSSQNFSGIRCPIGYATIRGIGAPARRLRYIGTLGIRSIDDRLPSAAKAAITDARGASQPL
jgi:hypothetical protein